MLEPTKTEGPETAAASRTASASASQRLIVPSSHAPLESPWPE
jgi:hypothetical protein